MRNNINSCFVNVSNRIVHFRHAGSGPVVVLLHPSPNWSKSLDNYTAVFSKNFSALAFDTPGYGYSEPLNKKEPNIVDFADALKHTLETLGIEKCALWGSHTGATIAMEFTIRYPESVSIFVADGYPAYEQKTRDEMLANHIPPYIPKWDGSHLLHTWHKFREMFIFSPTFKWKKENRTNSVPPQPEFIQDMILPRLITGELYTHAYSAVFKYDSLKPISITTVPTCFAARSDDSLIKGFPLIQSQLKDNCWVEEINPDKHVAAKKYLEILKSQPTSDNNFVVPPYKPALNKINRKFLKFNFGQIAIKFSTVESTCPLVFLPPVPGDSSNFDNLFLKFEKLKIKVYSIDMPGNGDSANWDNEHTINNYSKILKKIMDKLNLKQFHLIGFQGGASTALEYAINYPIDIKKLILCSPIIIDKDIKKEFKENYANPIQPKWDGTHLINLWFALRNEQLFSPWYKEKIETIRKIKPKINPNDLSLKMTGIIKHYKNYHTIWDSVFNYPIIKKFKNLEKSFFLLTDESDPFKQFSIDYYQDLKNFNFKILNKNEGELAKTIATYINNNENMEF